jgi:beta-lactamase superfamily II metal-dependent hydrolase
VRRWGLVTTALLAAVVATAGAALAAVEQQAPAPPRPAAGPGGSTLAAVHFLDVGPGRAVLITAGAHAVLVDGGSVAAAPAVLAALRGSDVRRLDALVTTSPRDDYVGGLLSVAEAVPVSRLLDGGWATDCALYRSLLNLARHRGIPVAAARAGTVLRLGPTVRLTVLLPTADESPPGPVTVMLQAGGVRFLLPGSLTAPDEERLLRMADGVRAQVVELGGDSAGSEPAPSWLDAVQPRLVVAQPGFSQAAGQRLAAAGIGVLRLDRLGDVVVGTDGRGLTVRVTPPPLPPVSAAPGGVAGPRACSGAAEEG